MSLRPPPDLERDIDRIVGALARKLKEQGEIVLAQVIVNASYHLEQKEYDNWNGGTYGYQLLFTIPSELFRQVRVRAAEQAIVKLLGELARPYDNQFFGSVLLTEELVDNPTWRADSGLLLGDVGQLESVEPSAEVDELWGPGSFRVFISHRAENKKLASSLKTSLLRWNIASFVAHDDIEPTKQWQTEIERALLTMDSLVALMCAGFHTSNWTDQELGFALARRRMIVPINIGTLPYGFIGRIQALPAKLTDLTGIHGYTSFESLARQIVFLMHKEVAMRDRVSECIVHRFERATSFGDANALMTQLETLTYLHPLLISRLREAPSKNRELEHAFDVQKKLPALLERLERQ